MHSIQNLKPMRRMTPYLVTAGVGFSTSNGTIAAQDTPAVPIASDGPPPTIDTDTDTDGESYLLDEG